MESNTSKLLARVVSLLFHPLLIPTLGFFILVSFIPGTELFSSRLKSFLYITVFLSTCVIPLLFIFILSMNPQFNREMNNHRDRMLPFLFTAFSVFLGSQLLGKLPLPGIFRLYLLGVSMVLIVLFLITFRWKISGHAAASGGLTGTCLALLLRYGMDLFWIVIGLFLVSGIVLTSRILLDKHNPSQVYAGYLIGGIGMFILLFYF